MSALMRRLRCGAGGGAAEQAELREQEDLEDRLRKNSSAVSTSDGVAAELPGDPPPYEYAVARLRHHHHHRNHHPSSSSSLLVSLNECPEPHFHAVQFQVHASVSESALHEAQLQQRQGFSSATCLATTAAVAACCIGGGGDDGDGCDDSSPPPPPPSSSPAVVMAAGGAKSYSALLCHTPPGGGEKEGPVQWFKISLQFGSGKVLTSLVQQWEGDDFCNTARWMTLPRPAAAAEECELDLADCIAALFHSARVEEMSPSTSFIATATVQTPRHPDVLNVHVHVPNSPAVRLREAGLGDGDGNGGNKSIKGESKQERMRRCRGAFLGALRHAQGESAKVEHLVSHSRGDVVREAARLCFAIARLDRPCVTWIRAAVAASGGGGGGDSQ